MKHFYSFSVFKGPGNTRQKTQAGFDRSDFFDDESRAFEDDLLLSYDDLLAEKNAVAEDDAILASVIAQSPVTGPDLTGQPATPEHQQSGDDDRTPAVNWTLPGFEGKCRVTTNFGDLPIEALRRRDKVKCISGAYAEVQWIDAIRLDVDFMERHPEAHPIMIRAKALGGNFPAKNMLVSSAQPIWIPEASGKFRSVFAHELEGHPNIMRMRKTEMTYYRFHVGYPEQVCIEGSWFFTCPED